MTTVRIPTPLRAYAGGLKEIEVRGETVAAALTDLARQYPAMQTHLFDDEGALRPYVNVFVNELDARQLRGDRTPLSPSDRLVIVPSIAGGANTSGQTGLVDHTALGTNQAMITALLAAAFLADTPWLVAAVGLIMTIGTLLGRPGFLPVYRLLRAARLVRPNVLPDNNSPHRFAQGLGAGFLLAGTGAFGLGISGLGWALSLLVASLAALNLFGGFCVGCAVYYWMNRLHLPGFTQSPPPGVIPGRRPEQRT